MADNREWMYSEWKQGRPPTDERVEHTKEFLDRAYSMLSLVADGQGTSTMSISHPFWPGKQVMCKKIGMSIPPEILASWESQQRHSSGSHMGNPDDRQQEDMENEWNTWFVGENMDLDRSFILLLAD
ncbi:hypothetical protein ACP70R_042765 [Stipagrostis hirtigluma subsp. patula]